MLPTCKQILTFRQITGPSSSRSGSPKCLACLTLYTKVLYFLQVLAKIYQSTRYNMPEDLNIQLHLCQNLKSHNKPTVLHSATVNLACCLHFTDHITQEGWLLIQFYNSVRFIQWYITTKLINCMDFFRHLKRNYLVNEGIYSDL